MTQSSPAGFTRRQRRPISLAPSDLVTSAPLVAGRPLPLVCTPAMAGVDLVAWVADNREQVRADLLVHAGVLFRSFGPREVEDFQEIVRILGGDLLTYSYASTPRSRVAGNVYTSTEYPASQEIPLHNELAYSHEWPMKLGFFSIQSAPEGGETPLADSRRVFARIPEEIRRRFAERRLRYVRNYGQGLDLSWADVFKTEDRAEVERFCTEAGIEWTWGDGDSLRTSQVLDAVHRHPETGEEVWFNQAHLFHVSSLGAEARATLENSLGVDNLPRNVYFGDGGPIPDSDLDAVRAAFAAEKVAFRWQDGDVLILENMLVAHGRHPFAGPRRLVVGMSEPYAAGAR